MPEKMKDPEVDLGGLFKEPRPEEVVEDIKDDGSGLLKVWRVENFELKDKYLPTYGIFYDGDSHVILYTYTQPCRDQQSAITYFWLGSHSTTDEKGAAALYATRIYRRQVVQGRSSQTVRVVQGKEPLHLLRCFCKWL